MRSSTTEKSQSVPYHVNLIKTLRINIAIIVAIINIRAVCSCPDIKIASTAKKTLYDSFQEKLLANFQKKFQL
jgi:hypothetical protein